MNLYEVEFPVYCSGEIKYIHKLFGFAKKTEKKSTWKPVTTKELNTTIVQKTALWPPDDLYLVKDNEYFDIYTGVILEVLDDFTLNIKLENHEVVNKSITKIIVLDTSFPLCIKEEA